MLEKFLKLILKAKQTSFLGQNLVLKCSPRLCFLLVPYHSTKFVKNPNERVPRTKSTNCLGQNC